MADLGNIALDQIRENPDALRAVARDTEQFLELVESVKSMGILNPISVRAIDTDGGDPEYVLVDGLHRYTAAQEAGLKQIPAQIVEASDVEVYEMQIVANVHKVDTRPIEYTKGLLRILGANPTLTQSELARKIGKSPSWLNERLRLLKLDSKIQSLVDEEKITLMNAHALSKLPPEEQGNYLDAAMTQPAAEFVPVIEERAKAIREAARQGRSAEKAEWAPTPHLRKMKELKEARTEGVAGKLVTKHSPSSASEAAQLMLDWVLNMDPEGVEAQRAKHDQREKEKDEAKKRRAAERTEQKAKEAAAEAAAVTTA